MRHRIAILLGGAIIAGLFGAIWLLVTGPLAFHFHSTYEICYAVLMLMTVCTAIVTGAVVGAWDANREIPHRHRHITFRTLLHH